MARPLQHVLPPPPRQSNELASPVVKPLSDDRKRLNTPVFGDTPMASALRYVRPTWRNYIMYVELEAKSGNEAAQRWVDSFNRLPKDEQRTHYPEQMCEFAGVSQSDVMSWVLHQAWAHHQVDASMCLSFLKAPMIEEIASNAMSSPDNYKDRELFAKIAGLLPIPGTGARPVTNVFSPVVTSSSMSLSGSKSQSCPPGALADMDQEIVDLSKIMQSGREQVQPYNAPDDDDDSDDDDDDTA